MSSANRSFANRIADAVHIAYDGLPLRGKPQRQEWTILAGIVLVPPSDDEQPRVLCLATGTKCLPLRTLADDTGFCLRDCHAEVLCRRMLVHAVVEDPVTWSDPSLRLVMYVSQAPCGDATIFERLIAASEQDGEEAMANACDGRASDLKRPAPHQGSAPAAPMSNRDAGTLKRQKLEESAMRAQEVLREKDQNNGSCTENSGAGPKLKVDVQRTGARVVGSNGGAGFPVASNIGESDQTQNTDLTPGRWRTKPGRGPPTASMSCSDKLARWQALGWEGAWGAMALSSSIPDRANNPPSIRLYALVIGEDFAADALERALHHRSGLAKDRTDPRRLRFLSTDLRFRHGRQRQLREFPGVKLTPAPASILVSWFDTMGLGKISNAGLNEVIVKGRKQGASAKPKMRETWSSTLCTVKVARRCSRRAALKMNNDDSPVLNVTEFKVKHAADYVKRKHIWQQARPWQGQPEAFWRRCLVEQPPQQKKTP
eukprot:Clim_evm10s99 gene=Clim_evmTU10s99